MLHELYSALLLQEKLDHVIAQQDWSMNFLSMEFHESQGNWFGKSVRIFISKLLLYFLEAKSLDNSIWATKLFFSKFFGIIFKLIQHAFTLLRGSCHFDRLLNFEIDVER